MPATTRRQTAAHSLVRMEGAGPSDIEEYLQNASHGVAKLRGENSHLTRENARLKEDLERLYEAQDVSIQPKPRRKGTASVLSLTAQVNKLKRRVEELEDARRKDKRKIRKLQSNEIKKDAMELNNEIEHGIRDESVEMKRLLRRFFQLMSSPSMEEKEDCAVCLAEMTLSAAKSLPCQHIFCASCLPYIMPQVCPNCREPFGSLEDTESVEFTATQQWDALLQLAAEWGRIDKGESPEVTDSEEQLPFIEDIEDRSEWASSTADVEEQRSENEEGLLNGVHLSMRRSILSPPPPDNDVSQTSQQAPNAPITPTRALPSPASYQSSPLSVKRQRLKELAEARLLKRTRL